MDVSEMTNRDDAYRQALEMSLPCTAEKDPGYDIPLLSNIKARTKAGGRLHLWEICSNYHCTIAGTCLSIKEQKNILKRELSIEDINDYGIHGIVIACSATENNISKRFDKLLNQKYHREIHEFSTCSEKEFLDAWAGHLDKGDICGLYWTAFSRGDLSNDTISHIFGDVHMFSHMNGKDNREYLKNAERVKQTNLKLSEKLDREKNTRRRLEKQLNELKRQLSARPEQLSPSIEGLKKDNETLLARIEKNNLLLDEQNKTISGLEKSNRRLEKELEDAGRKENLLEENSRSFDALPPYCNENCPAFDLCARRILIVGGITRIASRYRELIEEAGGTFDYHDGYMRGGDIALENQISRSDIILCPVDVNSHNACLSVKKICKRLNKTYQMLPGSSLTAISRALTDNHSALQQ